MASTINASTSAGVVTTADTSGNLNLQSNGTTIVALTSTGAAVTGTLSASGVTTFANGTAAAPSLSFTGASATGFYKGTGNAIDATLNGTQVLDINASSFDIKGALNFTTPANATINGVLLATSSSESSGQIGVHAASKATLSQESSTVSAITAYGNNTSTYGTLRLRYAYSNGGTTNGLSVYGPNGCIGIGVDSPTYQIQATTNANGLAYLYQTSSGTGVYLPLGNNAWSAASDERLKDIIEPITDAANKLSTLRTVIGKYKTDEDGTRRPFLIAQDVQKVMPEAIDAAPNEHDSGEKMLGLQYTNMIPLLVAAINELTARIAALEAK
jgi:hypothetical protein